MDTKSFNTTSSLLLMLRLFCAIIIIVVLMVIQSWLKIDIDNELLFLIVNMSLFLLINLALKKIFLIKVSINLTGLTKITISKQYFLFREVTKMYDLSQIRNYYFNRDGIFRISIKNGMNIKLLVDTEKQNLSKFLIFYKKFKKSIEKYNSANSNIIYESLPSHEKKSGAVYASILLILLILIPFFYLYKNTPVNIPLLMIIYPPCLVYIYKVYLFRKKD